MKDTNEQSAADKRTIVFIPLILVGLIVFGINILTRQEKELQQQLQKAKEDTEYKIGYDKRNAALIEDHRLEDLERIQIAETMCNELNQTAGYTPSRENSTLPIYLETIKICPQHSERILNSQKSMRNLYRIQDSK